MRSERDPVKAAAPSIVEHYVVEHYVEKIVIVEITVGDRHGFTHVSSHDRHGPSVVGGRYEAHLTTD